MRHLKARLTAPRIAPVEPADWDETVRAVLAPDRRPPAFGEPEAPVFNVFKTMANDPKLIKRISEWGGHVLFKTSLSPREREMAILRTGWVCGADYEFAHHRELALASTNLTDVDVERIKQGPQAPGLTAHEAAMLAAVDELLAEHFVSDATWAALARSYSVHQLMDLVFCVGHYAMMCAALNSFGVQLEPQFKPSPAAAD
jgi:alkylhydroperoxidase family enzyme